MDKLIENLVKLLEENSNEYTLQEFLDVIKDSELEFYKQQLNDYYKLYSKRSEYEPKDNSPAENRKWFDYVQSLDELCADYDIHDYARMMYEGEYAKAEDRLNKTIEEHIDKLAKSITKVTGKENVYVRANNSDDYIIEGNNGICTVKYTPIKLSSTKNIIKSKLKITDQEIKEKKQEPKKEENEYIKKWKEEELQGMIDFNIRFWNKLHDMREEKATIENELKEATKEYYEEHGEYPKKKNIRERGWRLVYEDDKLEEINTRYQNKNDEVNKEIDNNSFFYEYGNKPEFQEKCKKIIDKHFEELQNKVKAKIGDIVKITPTGNNGYDYKFEGTKGNCSVEVIWAGGYNIQRLHTRWIIKN